MAEGMAWKELHFRAATRMTWHAKRSKDHPNILLSGAGLLCMEGQDRGSYTGRWRLWVNLRRSAVGINEEPRELGY